MALHGDVGRVAILMRVIAEEDRRQTGRGHFFRRGQAGGFDQRGGEVAEVDEGSDISTLALDDVGPTNSERDAGT